MKMKTTILKNCVLLAAICLLAFKGNALERIEPSEGCYIGFTLGRGDTVAQLTFRLGITPAVYSKFFGFPFSNATSEDVNAFLEEASRVQGVAMLTLETWGGLEAVREIDCEKLSDICAFWEARGVTGVFIRFDHEMNGSWYPWGQVPILYKAKFRMLSQILRERTARTAMIWAPNYGAGYPFGKARPEYGSAEFAALDTNGDGAITDRDDSYAPYYPGDDVVDWVGMTIYHWGIAYPWLENEMPVPNSFADSLLGINQGPASNFYEEYCVKHGKPLMIPETAAFYNTEQPGPSELLLKQAWWQQVFAARSQFPKLKCINWFDEFKQEGVAQGNWIDWRVSADPRICSAFVRDLYAVGNGNRQTRFLSAQEALCADAPYCIAANELPEILPVSGEIALSLLVTAATTCDLVIDLLDANFGWQGGKRVSISAPGQTVITSFRIDGSLTDQTTYRWSIFLTPTGADYRAALAWYTGPMPSDDPDGDGARNDQEAAAGTSPRDALDVLALKIRMEGSRAILEWLSKIGRTYQLCRSPDLKAWLPVGGLIEGTGKLIQFPVGAQPSARVMNYRAQIYNTPNHDNTQ
jgi:hypothetical protein